MKNTINVQDLYRTNPEIFEGATKGLIDALNTNSVKQNVTSLRNRRLVTLAGQAELFDTTVNKIEGITDFDKGMLSGNQAFLVTGLQLRYARNASTTTPQTQRFSNLVYALDLFALNAGSVDTDAGATGLQTVAVPVQVIPTELLNADFNFQINSNVKFKAPASDFFIENQRLEKATGHEDYVVDLEHAPILLLPNKPLQSVLRFNPSVTNPSGFNHFVEITFRGSYIYE
jgi:hypothetical protein